jgi:hypothetical protein
MLTLLCAGQKDRNNTLMIAIAMSLQSSTHSVRFRNTWDYLSF